MRNRIRKSVELSQTFRELFELYFLIKLIKFVKSFYFSKKKALGVEAKFSITRASKFDESFFSTST